jgi:glycerophosphoryl diester phosphodiesterase
MILRRDKVAKVIIAGSRNIVDYSLVRDVVEFSPFIIDEVVSGTARGVDRLGERWARENDIPIRQFLADWDTYGKMAGFLRNRIMAEYADALIAIWDGSSRGTSHMVHSMKGQGKPCYVYKLNDPLPCPECGGKGEVFLGADMHPNPYDYSDYEEIWVKCTACGGGGKRNE